MRRSISDPAKWRVTPDTARLLQYRRHHDFQGIRPFFCKIDAVEAAIWLTEVAPTPGKSAAPILDHLKDVNVQPNFATPRQGVNGYDKSALDRQN